MSWATWLLFTGVPAWCVVLLVQCPGPLGSSSPVCPLGVLCGVCAVSWATWLQSTGVPARCVVVCVRCPGPFGSCSPVCPLGALLCVCGVLGPSAPVHPCARSVCCVAWAVSWATWLLFTGVPARCVACVCGVLGHLAPVHRCARSVRCFACAVSWATWLPFNRVLAWFVVLRVRCPGPLGSCSPVCPLGALLCVCGVLGHLAPVNRCARVVCCVACAVSWATWLLFTGVPARCVVLLLRCPEPLGSCSLVCPRGLLCSVCSVLGHLAPVHRCARSVRCPCVPCPRPLGSCLRRARFVGCFACAVSWATWLLFTGVPARCGALRVPCPGPLGSCSPVCPRGLLCWVLGVLGHLAPVHRCACSVCCFACAVSWATWLLFTGVPARCVALLRLGALPQPGGATGWLRGARGGRPRTGLIVPSAGPCRGRGAGLAPCCTRSAPRDGVVPGRSLWRRSWAACAAVVGVCGPGH